MVPDARARRWGTQPEAHIDRLRVRPASMRPLKVAVASVVLASMVWTAPANAAPATPEAQLAISVHGPASIKTNELLVETITVTNHGPDVAINVLDNYSVPPGMVSVTNVQAGPISNGTFTWHDGNMAVGQTVTHTVYTDVKGGRYYTVGGVVVSDTPDPYLVNNVSIALIRIIDQL
jgi:hypothetical protein